MSRRVLLAPVETAAVATAIRDGLRARGDHADLWTIAPHPFLRTEDRLLSGYAARIRAAFAAPREYDVLHYQFGTTLLEFVDCAWGKVAGRPLMLMHYWGDDCRLRLESGMRPIGAPAGWEVEQRAHERLLRRRLRLASRLCAAAIVSDLELAGHVRRWFRTVYLVPTPLSLPLPVAPAAPPDLGGEGPIVLHAPSNRLVKGTETIIEAVEAVGRRTPLRPDIVSGVPREQVLARIARADIVVDQLNSVTTGVFALEAMALGKPVLVQYDRALLAPYARDTPAVAVTAATLEQELEALVSDPGRRAQLGAAGKRFVVDTHAADAVASACQGSTRTLPPPVQGSSRPRLKGSSRYPRALNDYDSPTGAPRRPRRPRSDGDQPPPGRQGARRCRCRGGGRP